MKSLRKVERIITAQQTTEGAGFLVHRPFPTPALSDFDPFLMLDEMGIMNLGPGQAKGAPDHPHRGFETVTYLLSGEMEHRDSHGHSGKLTPGDVQWMTAGRGVIHSEMPTEAFQKTGGKMHGFQIWVNLPAKDKMMEPRYQEIPAQKIPSVGLDDGKVVARVIAGEVGSVKAVIDTRTPIYFIDFTVQPGGQVTQSIPADFNSFAYLVEGNGIFGADQSPAQRGQMVTLESGDADFYAKNTGTQPLRFLLLAGRPLNEPVARYGPFVMNTRREIEQAFRDYQNGTFVQ